MKRISVVAAAGGIGLDGAVIATAAMTTSAKPEDRFEGAPVGTFRFQLRRSPTARRDRWTYRREVRGLGMSSSPLMMSSMVRARRSVIPNGLCVLTSVVHGDYQCVQTVYLRNGSVEPAIGARGGASVFTLAVVGGTGQWVGARGEATLQALDPNANRSTLTLRPIR